MLQKSVLALHTERLLLQQPTFYQPATTFFCYCTLYKPTDSADLMVRC